MSKPILTFALSDDGNSVFVYTEGDELEAVLGIQREDFEFQLAEYAVHGVREAILSKQPH
jgi:hypothetical protein